MEGLVSEIIDGVQLIRFDRLEHQNALTGEMCENIADALSFGESNSQVRTFLITGGPGLFSVGLDVEELSIAADTGMPGSGPARMFKTIATIDKPIVAAVDGVASGAGVTLLMHCDYVVASEWATISAPYGERGLAPEGGASLLAPALIGYQGAFGLLVMGDSLDAPQAQRAGLVNRIVPAENVETAGLAAAAALAARPPEAVRLARRLMRGERRDVVTRIDLEADAFTDLLRSPAAQDALRRYIDQNR